MNSKETRTPRLLVFLTSWDALRRHGRRVYCQKSSFPQCERLNILSQKGSSRR